MTEQPLKESQADMEENANPKVDLAIYIDSRVSDLKELVQACFDALALALNVAKGEIDRRLEGMNELREQITSERGTYVTREVLDQKLSAIEGRVARVEFGNRDKPRGD